MLNLKNLFYKMSPDRCCVDRKISRADYLNVNAFLFEDNLKNAASSGEELYLLSLYRNMHREIRHYQNLFGLCLMLGAIHIYDIACGFNMQFGYLLNYSGISYTGIDKDEGRITYRNCYNTKGFLDKIEQKTDVFDYQKWNEILSMFNPQIKMIRKEYPFPIQTPQNSIAIAVGYHEFAETDLAAKTLTDDFERFIVQVDHETLPVWNKYFEGFHIKEIHRYNYGSTAEDEQIYILGTRYAEDLDYLEKSGYSYHDDRFFVNNTLETDGYLSRYFETVNKERGF